MDTWLSKERPAKTLLGLAQHPQSTRDTGGGGGGGVGGWCEGVVYLTSPGRPTDITVGQGNTINQTCTSLNRFSRRQTDDMFLIFSQKIGFDISCSPYFMQGEILLSMKD